MLNSTEIIKSFQQATQIKGKGPNSLNLYTVQRLLESGKDVKPFGAGKRRGAYQESALTALFRTGVLTKQEHAAAKDYCHAYELANISHHARPSYDGTPASSISYKSREICTQSQYEASKKIAESKNKLLVFNYKKDKRKLIDLRYFDVLDHIFERGLTVRATWRATGIDRNVLNRKIKEICNILLI